jgi:hypothetical protein
MEKKGLPLGSAVFLLALLGGFAAKQALFNKGSYIERYTDGRLIPIGGLMVNPHGLDGLQNDSEEDFRKLYGALTAYAKTNSRLPEDPRELVAFTSEWPANRRVTEEAFYSPDYKSSDVYSPLDEKFSYMWAYRSPRADGTSKPAFPKRGERDVWLATESYVRENKKVFRDGTYVSQPTGSYLLLWSDGKVEKVGLDRRRMARSGNTGYAYFFAGEANEMRKSDENLPKKGKWWPEPGAGTAKPDLSTGRGQ